MQCSVLCGGGTQKRSVSCRAGNWTRPSTYCADTDRPIDKRYCNEHKCSKVTDPSGMVKDTSPASDSSNVIENIGANSTLTDRSELGVAVPTTKSPSALRGGSRDIVVVEESDDSECTDQYRNCPLVVQARLCRYKYYKSVCCNSCSDAQLEYKN